MHSIFIFNTTINSGIAENKASEITIDMLNKLSDSAISTELHKKSLEILHTILFNDIHGAKKIFDSLSFEILHIKIVTP